MFSELYEVAKHTMLTMAITPRGDKLHVRIIPKPVEGTKAAALNEVITACATPEELDRDLPAAIAEYAAKANGLRKAIDLPIAALDEATSKAGKKTSTPASTPKARKAAVKKVVKAPAKVKKANVAKVAKPAKKAKGDRAPRVHTPAAPRPARAAPMKLSTGKTPKHPTLPARKPKIDQGTPEQCLEDGLQYLLAIGQAKPSRVLFIRFAITGRRYEKTWSSFGNFIMAARKKMPAAKPNAAQQELEKGDVGPSSDASQANPSTGDKPVSIPAGAAPVRTALNPAAAWPFPGTRTDKAPSTVRDVKTMAGKVIGATDRDLEVGGRYLTLSDDHEVVEVTADTIVVNYKGTEQRPEEAAPPADAGLSGTTRIVKTDKGTLLGTHNDAADKLNIGQGFVHAELGMFRVVEVTGDYVIVARPPEDGAPPHDTKTGDLIAQAGT